MIISREGESPRPMLNFELHPYTLMLNQLYFVSMFTSFLVLNLDPWTVMEEKLSDQANYVDFEVQPYPYIYIFEV